MSDLGIGEVVGEAFQDGKNLQGKFAGENIEKHLQIEKREQ